MQEEYNVTVDVKAFYLRPDTPKEGTPRKVRPGEAGDRLSEPLRTYAEEAGLVMRRPPIVSYTRYALQATEYAQQQGAFEPFHHGLYRAYWEHGKDLGDLEVIGEVAVECGLDWSVLEDRLTSGYYEETVMGQHREAMEHGIRGIPTFLIGNLMFSGARPYEVFQGAMEQVFASEGTPR